MPGRGVNDKRRVTVKEIKDDRQFYQAVKEYTNKIWEWRGFGDEDFDGEPTPDEFIQILEERIEWIRAHKKAVDRYLRKRNGPTWVRVIDGAGSKSAS